MNIMGAKKSFARKKLDAKRPKCSWSVDLRPAGKQLAWAFSTTCCQEASMKTTYGKLLDIDLTSGR
jgi:hypothetical protein